MNESTSNNIHITTNKPMYSRYLMKFVRAINKKREWHICDFEGVTDREKDIFVPLEDACIVY